MASAWDDDWETTADKLESTVPDPPRPAAQEPKISRAQRKLLHQEANRQLWQAAETPKDTPIFIQARAAPPPLASAVPIKQAVKVLARRPAQTTQRQQQQKPRSQPDANQQVGVSAQYDDDDPDSEEEERRKNAATFAERQERAAREREEKQKKYAEVRERLFGSSPQPGSGAESASPRQQQAQSISRPGSSGPNAGRTGNGRGRGVGSSTRGGGRDSARLYEPDYAIKPDSAFTQRREGIRTPVQSGLEKPVREPKGPDATGRGFASRGRGT